MKGVARRAVIVCLLMPAQGCGMLFGVIGKPKVETVSPRIVQVGLDGVGMSFELRVRNPYWFPLRVPLVRYGLHVQGHELLRSEAPLDVALPRRGVGTLTVPARVSYARLLALHESLRGASEAEYTLQGAIPVSALGITLELPVWYSDKFPIVRPPQFADVRLRVNEVSLAKAVVTIQAAVTNPNAFEVDIQGLGYTLRVGDAELAGLRASTAGSVGARQTGQLTLVAEVAVAKVIRQIMGGGGVEKPELVPTGSLKTPYGVVNLDQGKGK